MTEEFYDASAEGNPGIFGDQGPPTVGIEFFQSSDILGSVVTTTRYFRMRGIDQTCPVGQQPAYVYWTVEGVPDPIASQLTAMDLPCGTDPSTDVIDIHVAFAWRG